MSEVINDTPIGAIVQDGSDEVTIIYDRSLFQLGDNSASQALQIQIDDLKNNYPVWQSADW